MAEQAEQMALKQENQRALDELREKLCREKELVRIPPFTPPRGWEIRRSPLGQECSCLATVLQWDMWPL